MTDERTDAPFTPRLPSDGLFEYRLCSNPAHPGLAHRSLFTEGRGECKAHRAERARRKRAGDPLPPLPPAPTRIVAEMRRDHEIQMRAGAGPVRVRKLKKYIEANAKQILEEVRELDKRGFFP